MVESHICFYVYELYVSTSWHFPRLGCCFFVFVSRYSLLMFYKLQKFIVSLSLDFAYGVSLGPMEFFSPFYILCGQILHKCFVLLPLYFEWYWNFRQLQVAGEIFNGFFSMYIFFIYVFELFTFSLAWCEERTDLI
jgi:hypothetical protein